MTPEQLQGWLQAGLGVAMLAALFFGYKRLWVFGWLYDSVVQERDEWKEMAIRGLQTAADVAQAAKRHTTLTPSQADKALKVVREAGTADKEPS